MIFAILLMFVFASVLLFKNIKNKYSWIFIILFLALNIILFSLLIHINKLSSYRSIFSIENYIYIWLGKIKISFYDVKNIVNIGIALFLLGMCGFLDFTEKTDRKSVFKKIGVILLLIFPILVYIFLNSYRFSEYLYISINESESQITNNIIPLFMKFIVIYNYIMVIVYILLPFLVLRKAYINTNIMFKKTQTKVLGASLILVDLFFVGFFILGPFKNIIINNIKLFDFDVQRPEYSQYVYTYMPVIVLILFDVVCYILIHYRLLDSVNFMKNRIVLKNTKLLPNDIRHVFHSYKNSMFSIAALEEKVEEHYGADIGFESLKEIKVLAVDFMKQAGDFLDMLSELIPNIDEINIIECIDKAIQKVSPFYDIKIEKKYYISEAYALADKNQITEMFYNIFLNSIEAIEKKSLKDGEISVSVYVDTEWLCICIRDNGCGISKKNKKNIFKPLFSTKRTYNNWGIGLSYVYKVVKAHIGIIFVDSELDKYTEIQVLLPNSKNKLVDIW